MAIQPSVNQNPFSTKYSSLFTVPKIYDQLQINIANYIQVLKSFSFSLKPSKGLENSRDGTSSVVLSEIIAWAYVRVTVTTYHYVNNVVIVTT